MGVNVPSWTARYKSRGLVQCVFQLLAGAELRLARSLDLNFSAGLGIASLSSRTIGNNKNTKPCKAHLVPALEGVRDRVENPVDSLGRLVLAEAGSIRESLNQVVFVHRTPP